MNFCKGLVGDKDQEHWKGQSTTQSFGCLAELGFCLGGSEEPLQSRESTNEVLRGETNYSMIPNISVCSDIQYKIMWFTEDDSQFH